MPSEVVKSELLPATGREKITVMDDYGTAMEIYVPVSEASLRQGRIDDAIAQQNTNQTQVESYAAAATPPIDLSAQKAAGIAKKEAIKKGSL